MSALFNAAKLAIIQLITKHFQKYFRTSFFLYNFASDIYSTRLMIPKKIHYCWFGHNPLPKSAIKCIESWKKFLPDYEIVEWNEENFDIGAIAYTAQAYQVGKYAFVSDYARFKILYDNGGLYFDTDVELIAPIGDIIENGNFMGFETDCGEKTGEVNPGLGLGASKGNPIYKDILDYYSGLRFIKPDGTLETTTIVVHTTDVLRRHGLRNVPGIQKVGDISIYPAEYFNPFDWKTGLPHTTPNSRSIHWYAKTWVSPGRRFYQKFKYFANRLLGKRTVAFIKKMVGLEGKHT